MLWYKGVEINSTARTKAEEDPQAPLGIASTVVKATTKEIVLPLEKSAKSMVRTTTLKQSVKVSLISVILGNTDPNKNEKGKCSMR